MSESPTIRLGVEGPGQAKRPVRLVFNMAHRARTRLLDGWQWALTDYCLATILLGMQAAAPHEPRAHDGHAPHHDHLNAQAPPHGQDRHPEMARLGLHAQVGQHRDSS